MRQRGAVLRVATVALFVGWAGYVFELRPALGSEGAHPLTERLTAAAGLAPGALGDLGSGTWLPGVSWLRSLGHTLLLEPRAAPSDTLAAVAAAVPWGLWGLLAGGLLGFVHLRRDRADVPSLLLGATIAPLAAAFVLPPRLTVTCALLAVPAIVLLGASAVARLATRRPGAAFAAAAAVAGLFALQWAVGRAPRELALLPVARPPAARLSTEEAWRLDRYAAAYGLEEIHVVAGRGRGVFARDDRMGRYHEPGDEALERVLARVTNGSARAALVVGEWLLDEPALAPLADATPTGRVGRLVVFGLR